MPDLADQAAAVEEAERERAINRALTALCHPGEPLCLGCGDLIPPARRAALPSAARCADCQGEVELIARRNRPVSRGTDPGLLRGA